MTGVYQELRRRVSHQTTIEQCGCTFDVCIIATTNGGTIDVVPTFRCDKHNRIPLRFP